MTINVSTLVKKAGINLFPFHPSNKQFRLSKNLTARTQHDGQNKLVY